MAIKISSTPEATMANSWSAFAYRECKEVVKNWQPIPPGRVDDKVILKINQKYLLDAIDKIHDALCPGKSGTWQMRVEQAVEAAKKQHNWREELAKDLVEYLSIYDDRDVSHTETFIRNWKPKEANAIQ